MVDTLFFSDAAEFSDWFEAHRHQTPEAWVLFHKKGSGRVSQTWSEAVDVALYFGWIDGLRKSIDSYSYSYKVRFTPRKKNSVWSTVNIRKVEALMRLGKMRPEGLELFNRRKDSQGYSAETRRVKLNAAYEQKFKEHRASWEKFLKFAPSYQRDADWWVMSAKKEETRLKRLDILMSSSCEGKRVPVFRAKLARPIAS